MKAVGGVVAVAVCVVVWTCGGVAEETSAQPRYKLRTDSYPKSSEDSSQIDPESFSWKALSNRGPGNGGEPVIGPGSGKPYYRFDDSLAAPERAEPEPF